MGFERFVVSLEVEIIIIWDVTKVRRHAPQDAFFWE